MFLIKQVKLCLLSLALFTSGISYGGCFGFLLRRQNAEIARLQAEIARRDTEIDELARRAADELKEKQKLASQLAAAVEKARIDQIGFNTEIYQLSTKITQLQQQAADHAYDKRSKADFKRLKEARERGWPYFV